MNEKLNSHVLGLAGAGIAALGMLLLGIGANIGIYESAATQMAEWHLFFTFSLGGIIAGMIESAIVTYIFLYAFAWLYNKLLERAK